MIDVHLLTPQGDQLVVQVVDGQVIVPATQDHGRMRQEELLEKGRRELQDRPPVDTTELSPTPLP